MNLLLEVLILGSALHFPLRIETQLWTRDGLLGSLACSPVFATSLCEIHCLFLFSQVYWDCSHYLSPNTGRRASKTIHWALSVFLCRLTFLTRKPWVVLEVKPQLLTRICWSFHNLSSFSFQCPSSNVFHGYSPEYSIFSQWVPSAILCYGCWTMSTDLNHGMGPTSVPFLALNFVLGMLQSVQWLLM